LMLELRHNLTHAERRTRGDSIETSIYLPDELYNLVAAFAQSSDATLEATLVQLLSKGMISKHARDYRELLLRKNSLMRSELYSEYSRDGEVLRRLVDQMRSENLEIKRVLVEKGLLRRIPEKHRP
jgi:hypothetical protein